MREAAVIIVATETAVLRAVASNMIAGNENYVDACGGICNGSYTKNFRAAGGGFNYCCYYVLRDATPINKCEIGLGVPKILNSKIVRHSYPIDLVPYFGL